MYLMVTGIVDCDSHGRLILEVDGVLRNHNIRHNVHHNTMHNVHHNIMHNVHHNISDMGGNHVIKRVTKKINIHCWHFLLCCDDAELSFISL